MSKRRKFDTLASLASWLLVNGYRQDADGRWSRDSWNAHISQQKNGVWVLEII